MYDHTRDRKKLQDTTALARGLAAGLDLLTNRLDELDHEISLIKNKTRCTANTISGNHALHSTNQNCPHPNHRQATMPDGYRIRAYIRKGERPFIEAAMEQQQIYSHMVKERRAILSKISHLAHLVEQIDTTTSALRLQAIHAANAPRKPKP